VLVDAKVHMALQELVIALDFIVHLLVGFDSRLGIYACFVDLQITIVAVNDLIQGSSGRFWDMQENDCLIGFG
jgi:hypothetical protein